ncbi:hypothetical protein LX99_04070 [Mucilaginibacter oryzae]|uniref:Restriction endonuclease n=1 Tax=Mucilaginibacter oryzae TaxID=468058 RepID=A0A316HA40_9SPHI|nr:hypothetical protein [Mucilaginibacter oryzae]PWK74268.1 hypothetical protein LX99_04070 [Mucilaginibacter oryzae]
MELEITEHFKSLNLDVRKSGDARFSDQKCTPDVVSIIADCVVNIRLGEPLMPFTVKDIWDSNYFNKHVKAVFNKPSAQNPTTKSEYDKFIQQPLRLLAYANVLKIERRGNTNHYTINNGELLDYIALKDRNAYVFLSAYFSKVLGDSGMLRYFDEYRDKYLAGKLKQSDFDSLKYRFQTFMTGNTRIDGTTEVNRIFPKILNVYACENSLPGSAKGKMTAHPFSYSDLMYNRPNWRDGNKNKQISRQEAIIEVSKLPVTNVSWDNYLIQKAITNIKRWHPDSEVKDQWSYGEATQVHHIFPANEFPLLAHYVENLIRLTPTQHNTKAHPSNNTRIVDRDYQSVCVIAKSHSIENSIKAFGERFYKKSSFVYVVNTGLNLETVSELKPDLTFNELRNKIIHIYNNS